MKKFTTVTFMFVAFALCCICGAKAELISYENTTEGKAGFNGINFDDYSVSDYYALGKDKKFKNSFGFDILGTDGQILTTGTVTNPLGKISGQGNSGFEPWISDVEFGFNNQTFTQIVINFAGDFITSVGLNLAAHNAKDEYITVIATTVSGQTETLTQNARDFGPAFYGFSVTESDTGTYDYIKSLTLLITDSYGNLNNGNGGIKMTGLTLGYGSHDPEINPSGGSATPEPATMLVVGLGLAGAGFFARRRMGR